MAARRRNAGAPLPSIPDPVRTRDVCADRAGETASKRASILARSYLCGQSAEDDARLAILTERLREIQRVSEEDVAVLEEAAQQLEDSMDMRRRLEEKYGL